ncbi:MAG TPA: YbhB/YbcL family Raf kinase inhibitor-like protein [Xanthobacteraceae bacterium]|nr:YbhB/YbcL family Raf kinase inhibitor-like protein [Xanthobacteraceae bacterium]
MVAGRCFRGSRLGFRRGFRLGAAAGGAALVVALAATLGASRAFAFSASFAWCPEASPNFEIKDVPAGTVSLQFAMTDLDKPSFHHGGGTVGYRGQSEVPCGAFASGFVGPAPPPGEVHTYEFVIKALAQNGTVLATTTAQKKFPQ